MKGSSVQPETPQAQHEELPARYEKLKTLWGEDALRAIVNAHVLVLGIGGVDRIVPRHLRAGAWAN